ncbi:MAG: 30S ribosomal protein S2 [Mycoplasma sp.]
MSDTLLKDESVTTKKTTKRKPKVTENAEGSVKNTTSRSRTGKFADKKANSSPRMTSEKAMKNIEAKIDAFFKANEEFGIKKLVSPAKLMEVNANIGTPAKYWNPKMKPFIYTGKHGRNHIIDLLKCMVFLDRAYKFLVEITKEGGKVLFVGTRGEIIRNHVKEEAKRANAYYVNQRWLGGTLTNFRTINRSIIKLNNLIMMQLNEEINKYSKKEQLQKIKETEKLGKFFGGIRTMKGLPQALVVLDPVVEKNAVIEAKKLNIPVVALANTNADPTLIDFIIPCNTFSIKTVYLLTSVLTDAICEGLGEPKTVVGKPDEEIILPDLTRKNPTAEVINRKSFTKGANVVEETPKATVVEETKTTETK